MGKQSPVVSGQSSETVVGRWSLVVGQLLLALTICLFSSTSFAQQKTFVLKGGNVAYGFARHD